MKTDLTTAHRYVSEVMAESRLAGYWQVAAEQALRAGDAALHSRADRQARKHDARANKSRGALMGLLVLSELRDVP